MLSDESIATKTLRRCRSAGLNYEKERLLRGSDHKREDTNEEQG